MKVDSTRNGMRIQIIGLGTVGTAQAYLLKKLNHEIYGYDVKHSPNPYCKIVTTPKPDVDITFICVPETQVEHVIFRLIKEEVQGLYVVKSSTPPGTTRSLAEKYQVHICHNPEFLREKHAFYDVENPSRIIIGQCCEEHGHLLKRLYEPLNKPIYITDPTTSELVKLTTNALRAVSITFWNAIYEVATALDLDIREVVKLVNPVRTIGEWEGGEWGTRFFGKRYGGKCLPKDVDQLITTFRRIGIDPILFQAIQEYNKRFPENIGDNK